MRNVRNPTECAKTRAGVHRTKLDCITILQLFPENCGKRNICCVLAHELFGHYESTKANCKDCVDTFGKTGGAELVQRCMDCTADCQLCRWEAYAYQKSEAWCSKNHPGGPEDWCELNPFRGKFPDPKIWDCANLGHHCSCMKGRKGGLLPLPKDGSCDSSDGGWQKGTTLP